MDHLINSLHRGKESTTTLRGLEVDPGESLANTCGTEWDHRSPPILRGRRGSLARARNRSPVSTATTRQWALGARPKCWAKWRCLPAWGVSTVLVRYTVIDGRGVPPPDTSVPLKQIGAVTDWNIDTVELKKIETTTSLRVLPSGHVAHKLTEFAPGGSKAPSLTVSPDRGDSTRP